VRVVEVESQGTDGLSLRMDLAGDPLEVTVGVPGLYNAYNVAAAASLCKVLGIDAATIGAGLSGFSAAFGRVERIPFPEGKTALLLLAKNPTGFNEVIRTVAGAGEPRHTLVALNDNIADGRDVSWIWDVDFERLAGVPRSLVASGVRAHDMALRLKYAGFEPSAIAVVTDTRAALQRVLDSASPGETVNVLLTYTALLDLRGRLEREGLAPRFWEE
jgi:UDP-N-acetylmuramyl tripeptide synthase